MDYHPQWVRVGDLWFNLRLVTHAEESSWKKIPPLDTPQDTHAVSLHFVGGGQMCITERQGSRRLAEALDGLLSAEQGAAAVLDDLAAGQPPE
jgi:hypothetical protein